MVEHLRGILKAVVVYDMHDDPEAESDRIGPGGGCHLAKSAEHVVFAHFNAIERRTFRPHWTW